MYHRKIKAQHPSIQRMPQENALSLIPSKLANWVTFRMTRHHNPVQKLVEKSK
jgi:hypothetical protein